MEGIVIRALGDKRFGFIKGKDGKEYFFHSSDLNGFYDDLVSDVMVAPVAVKFNVVKSDKGPRAGEVTRLDAGVRMD